MKLKEVYGRDPYANSAVKNVKGAELVWYVETRSPGKIQYRVKLVNGKLPSKDDLIDAFEGTWGGKVSAMNKDNEFFVTVYID